MSSATLADQTAAVLEAIDTARGRPMVVGHSAACSLAWLATDARPDTIEKVVFVGGFPSSDGTPYADVFPVREGLMALPRMGTVCRAGLRRLGRRHEASHRRGGDTGA